MNFQRVVSKIFEFVLLSFLGVCYNKVTAKIFVCKTNGETIKCREKNG